MPCFILLVLLDPQLRSFSLGSSSLMNAPEQRIDAILSSMLDTTVQLTLKTCHVAISSFLANSRVTPTFGVNKELGKIKTSNDPTSKTRSQSSKFVPVSLPSEQLEVPTYLLAFHCSAETRTKWKEGDLPLGNPLDLS